MKKKCTDKTNRDFFNNITYKVQTISFLLEEAEKNTSQNKAFHNNAAYLSGYLVEFLIKMAICLSGKNLEYPALHSGEELFDYYKATLKKSSVQELINLKIIRNLPIAKKFDINTFRYDPSSSFRTFGYDTTGKLRDDLAKVTTQANHLKKKFLLKFTSRVMP